MIENKNEVSKDLEKALQALEQAKFIAVNNGIDSDKQHLIMDVAATAS